jgi:thioredoxin reductase
MNLPLPSLSPSPAPVAVIGAGPVGLAAAAHLVQRGMPVIVFEAGARVADNLGTYRQVKLFSPWRYNVDRAARDLLVASGWSAPDDERLPTAGELVDDYLEPLARTPALAPHIHFDARVTAVSRAGFDKVKTAGREHADFLLQVQTAGGVREVRARAVIDASGTWSQPNPLGVHGLPAVGEAAAREHIVHGMPAVLGTDRARYAGRKVLVVGSGHSAAGNLLALATLAEQEPRTRLAWAVRGNDLRRLFGGGEKDGLPARGELGQRLQALVEQGRLELHLGFGIREIVSEPAGLRVLAADPTKPPIEGIDQIIASTGSRPDLGIARELRLRLDPWLESTEALAPLIDPNVHSCGTVRPHGHRELAHPEPGFFAIGAKSYGRAPNFLMATGYEQARSVVAALAGDLAAADDVQLELPETGVCSVDLASPDLTGGGGACCGGPPKADASACCSLDEESKAEGKAGCGCGAPVAAPAPTTRVEVARPAVVPIAAVAASSCCR